MLTKNHSCISTQSLHFYLTAKLEQHLNSINFTIFDKTFHQLFTCERQISSTNVPMGRVYRFVALNLTRNLFFN
jgi:hypothetical protein